MKKYNNNGDPAVRLKLKDYSDICWSGNLFRKQHGKLLRTIKMFIPFWSNKLACENIFYGYYSIVKKTTREAHVHVSSCKNNNMKLITQFLIQMAMLKHGTKGPL